MQKNTAIQFMQRNLIRQAFELIRVLSNNGPIYPLLLHKHMDMTYSHINKVVHILEKNGILATKKIGRRCYINLTPKGIEISNHINQIYNEFTGVNRLDQSQI